nr:embryonic stem cell-related gene protein-like [Gorilla gorilla gorilla]
MFGCVWSFFLLVGSWSRWLRSEAADLRGTRVKFWCRDSDQGTSLRRSISCSSALCSVRKTHLRPQVLRPTSPRNITPILNQPLPEPMELQPKAF